MNIHPQLQEGLRLGIYWITKRIAIGPYASESRCEWLLQQGVTHILNVADTYTTALSHRKRFRSVVALPIVDFEPIPVESALRCVDAINEAMSARDSKLFVHCIAGQNRSPTILWLFLLACGIEPGDARRLIMERCPDAVPGHSALVSDALIAAVRAYGRAQQMPAHDAAVTAPAY